MFKNTAVPLLCQLAEESRRDINRSRFQFEHSGAEAAEGSLFAAVAAVSFTGPEVPQAGERPLPPLLKAALEKVVGGLDQHLAWPEHTRRVDMKGRRSGAAGDESLPVVCPDETSEVPIPYFSHLKGVRDARWPEVR